MISKIFKVVWVFSLFAVLGLFMYAYAGLPDPVVIFEADLPIQTSRNLLFYGALVVITLANFLAFANSNLLRHQPDGFKSWLYGLIIVLNIFFVIALNFISLYNSGERFDYTRLGIIIYGVLILVLVWALAWPVLAIGRRFFAKS
ncbi:MAG: hypothetical protein JNL17_06130 [Cyclobacteriaceae bacterium]|nr:hypothetical protein [Cyclobacteriaceae bacterium]